MLFDHPIVASNKASAFTSSSLRSRVVAARVPSRSFALQARAQMRAYPDPDYIAEVLESFPDKQIANVEEGRILFTEGGYIYLDVRPELELDAVGKVKGCMNVPFINAKWKYDPEQNKKVVVKEDPNPEAFIAAIKKKIPDTEAKILVGDSDGVTYALDALEALDEAGYYNIVGLKGGFYAWYKVWDANLRRRRGDGYTEAFEHDGDGCGIHGTGAGFARVDKIEAWVPPKF